MVEEPDSGPSAVSGTTQSHMAVEPEHVQPSGLEPTPESQRDYAHAILRALNVAWILSRDQQIVDVNGALCELTGFSRNELVGSRMPWPFWVPDGAEPIFDAAVPDIGRAGYPRPSLPVEIPVMHRNGIRFIVEIVATPAHLPDGSALGWVTTFHDVSVRHDYTAHLERMATHDSLTGLPNRRLFQQRLVGEMASSIRRDRSLSLVLLDLDNFKEVNDSFGHPVGDRALVQTADRLTRVLRKGELLVRLGGEEFAWIVPEVDADGAWAAAERAREAICGAPFEDVGELTISVGLAMRDGLRNAATMYERADQALYFAKRGGRNQTVAWDSSMAGIQSDRFRDFGRLEQ